MTFSRIKPLGWSVNEKLTSTQMNSLDTDHANALDKTVAGDSLAGPVTFTGVGRMIESVVAGANANTTYYATSGRVIVVTSSVNNNRTYTLSATGAVAGDTITIMATSSFAYQILVADSASGLQLCTVGHSPTDCMYLSAEFMFDGTRWRVKGGASPFGIRYIEYTSNSAFVCPQDVYSVLVYGFGGGGGGGNGVSGQSVIDVAGPGGSGGGGAKARIVRVDVTPGSSYLIGIGAGGGAGSNGSSTSFGSLLFYGGGAGISAGSANTATTFKVAVTGGRPHAISGKEVGQSSGTTDAFLTYTLGELVRTGAISGLQHGGSGGDAIFADASNGYPAEEGYIGGTKGNNGSSTGSYVGGGGGGGGGGGPRGNGANGGAGGNANNAGAGAVGTAGSSASANTGAGGGGGGGGGAGSSSGGAGGTGGSGGSGFLAVWY